MCFHSPPSPSIVKRVCVFLSAFPAAGCNICVCSGTVSEEHRQLQQLHIRRSEEQEGAALKLQGQLRDTHEELQRVRSTLRTLEGADGHG